MKASDTQHSFRIGPREGRTIGARIGVAAILVVGLIFVLISVGGVLAIISPDAESDPVGDALVVAILWTIAGLCFTISFKKSRFIQDNRGTVSVVGDHLMIDVSAYFTRPVAIPIQSIRMIAVDRQGPQGWDAATGGGAIPVYRQVASTTPGAAPTAAKVCYLQASQYEAGRLFQPTFYTDWPNVVIILEQSMIVAIDACQGAFKRRAHQDFALPGFGLRALDATAASRVLGATGKLRDVYEVDVAHVNAQVYGEAMPMMPVVAPAQPYAMPQQQPPVPPPPYTPAATG
jgi:hypothetical protein